MFAAVPAAPAASSVFSPKQALERARAVQDDAAFARPKEEAAGWQPPADMRERMEAMFTV
jgi:hypothetical protein